MNLPDNSLATAKKVIADADAIAIFAGAGMSVDSGLPDFRGDEGFWGAYPAAKQLGLSFADLATPMWFNSNPGLAWAFYGHRMRLYNNTQPHDGYAKLLAVAEAKPAGYFVFTSNVDGHFAKAGFAKERIVECHGSIHQLQCADPCNDQSWSTILTKINIEEANFKALNPLPACHQCGGLARPNILMFNDNRWLKHDTEAQKMRMYEWIRPILDNDARLAVIEIGAGTAIKTVRHQTSTYMNFPNSRLIRINRDDSQVEDGHIGITGNAKEVLDLIL